MRNVLVVIIRLLHDYEIMIMSGRDIEIGYQNIKVNYLFIDLYCIHDYFSIVVPCDIMICMPTIRTVRTVCIEL